MNNIHDENKIYCKEKKENKNMKGNKKKISKRWEKEK